MGNYFHKFLKSHKLFISFLLFLYFPCAHSHLKNSDTVKICPGTFSNKTSKSEREIDFLLDQIRNSSGRQTRKILKNQPPETRKKLAQKIFSKGEEDKAKYNLLYAFSKNPPTDSETQWILTKALLLEEPNVKLQVIRTIEKINKHIKSENLLEIIQILGRAAQFGESDEIRKAAQKALNQIKKQKRINLQ